MEQLPMDVFVNVLDYMDVVMKIRLATCNTTLQHRIYHDCALQAWNGMDFWVVEETHRHRLTDSQLSALLSRVNARDNTQVLDLSGCTQIRGTGLAPLRNSRVLSTITLLETAVPQNPVPVLWILRTMLEHKLFCVRIHGGVKTKPDAHVLEFQRNLRDAKARQAQQEETLCHCCSHPVMEPSRQVIPMFHGIPSTRCFQCDFYFCRKGHCPMAVTECRNCGECSCVECASNHACHFCGGQYCLLCQSLSWCEECFKYGCNECLQIFHCDKCGTHVCPECGTTASCSNQCFLCTACRQEGTCSGCNAQSCSRCTPMEEESDVPNPCNKGCLLCSNCRERGNCAECKMSFCVTCSRHSRQCSVCFKSYCGNIKCLGPTHTCGTCHDSFCIDCRWMEKCSGCNKGFCVQHKSLIDCDKCRMRLFAFGQQCEQCHESCGKQERKRKRVRMSTTASPKKENDMNALPIFSLVSPEPKRSRKSSEGK